MEKTKHRIFSVIILSLVIFSIAFLLSSGLVVSKGRSLVDQQVLKIKATISHHINVFDIYPNTRYYFLVPENRYLEFNEKRLSPELLLAVLFNALFNSLFQPLFLCVLTPQAILNFFLFPFFLYGAIKYFRRLPIMILIFFWMYIYSALRSPIVEALVRHRMSCELIYLLIGLAGFINWTEKNLF